MKKNYCRYEQRDSLRGSIGIWNWDCGCHRVESPYGNVKKRCPSHPDEWPETHGIFREFDDWYDTYEMDRLRRLFPSAPVGDGALIKYARAHGIEPEKL